MSGWQPYTGDIWQADLVDDGVSCAIQIGRVAWEGTGQQYYTVRNAAEPVLLKD